MFQLRPYQQEIKNQTYEAWASGAKYVLIVLPTGAGKTVTFADIITAETMASQLPRKGASCAIAHRQELVSQISLALARDGVRHKIIGPPSIVKLCVSLHISEVGKPFYDPNAECAVAGVDTIKSRKAALKEWGERVTLWVQDEAHHVLKENKWGKAIELFPNARGLGVTATPERADGKGLGRDYDGVFDVMIVGPSMRDLIDQGFLTEYRVFAPPSNLVVTDEMVSKTTGDYKLQQVGVAVQNSSVIGDVVSHYQKIAPGKLGVTFATDVTTAGIIADEFNEAGVPAEVVHAKTGDKERVAILKRFKNRELLQLVNVDLFGEGFDLPAIEVVSMARPTQSYGLYVQQFGRALRLMENKEYALIIDHVGNVLRHNLPDAPRKWSLARRESKRGVKENTVKVKSCPKCTMVYDRFKKDCPYCGFSPEPVARSGPEFVDGDLEELDADTLKQMRAEVAKENLDVEAFRETQAGIPTAWQLSNVKKHAEKLEAREGLKNSIALWAGYQRAAGHTDSESYRKFYIEHGVDVLSAQKLGRKDTLKLKEAVDATL